MSQQIAKKFESLRLKLDEAKEETHNEKTKRTVAEEKVEELTLQLEAVQQKYELLKFKTDGDESTLGDQKATESERAELLEKRHKCTQLELDLRKANAKIKELEDNSEREEMKRFENHNKDFAMVVQLKHEIEDYKQTEATSMKILEERDERIREATERIEQLEDDVDKLECQLESMREERDSLQQDLIEMASQYED